MQRDVERGNTTFTGSTKKSGSRIAEVAPWAGMGVLSVNYRKQFGDIEKIENDLVTRVVNSRGPNTYHKTT